MLIPLGFLAASGVVPALPAFDRIQSTTISTNTAIVSFTNIPQTYKHLQFVVTGKVNGSGTIRAQLRLNGNNDFTAGWAQLGSFGAGSLTGAISTQNQSWINSAQYFPTGFSGGIQGNWQGTLLDYSLTTKGKSFIAREGMGSTRVGLGFGYKDLNAAITSLEFYFDFNQWLSGSTFSLYGIKG